MATVLSKPQFVTGNATVINTGDELIVSITIANLGAETASNVFLTSATLGAARRISPQNFPVFIGNLQTEASGSLGAKFRLDGLTVGQKYLFTARGTYDAGATLGFAVSRYLTVPAAAPYATPILKAHLSVALNNATWTYTIFNDEPLGSSLYIAAFHLDVAAPVSVTRSPPGWQAESDAISYAGWISTDDSPPFPTHLPPQQSLGGFEIQSPTARSESTSYSLVSWDHARNDAGPVGLDTVLSPSRSR